MSLKASKSQDGVEITNPVTQTLLTATVDQVTLRTLSPSTKISTQRARGNIGELNKRSNEPNFTHFFPFESNVFIKYQISIF